ncbi:MAG: methyl-accepting chemotaxis protein [Thermodesulfobacteriota bacterium]
MNRTIRAKIWNLLICALVITVFLTAINLFSLNVSSDLLSRNNRVNDIARDILQGEALKNAFLEKMEPDLADRTLTILGGIRQTLETDRAEFASADRIASVITRYMEFFKQLVTQTLTLRDQLMDQKNSMMHLFRMVNQDLVTTIETKRAMATMEGEDFDPNEASLLDASRSALELIERWQLNVLNLVMFRNMDEYTEQDTIIQERLEVTQNNLAVILKLIDDPQLIAAGREVIDTIAAQRTLTEQTITAWEKQQSLNQELEIISGELNTYTRDFRSATEASIDRTTRKTRTTVLVGSTLMILFILLFGMSNIRAITRVLNGAIYNLRTVSDRTSSASKQFSSTSQDLAGAASEQAASVEETSSSIEEMASMTRQNAENANLSEKIMAETSAAFQKAEDHLKDMVGAVDEITRNSEETERIVKTIDEIAFQTNLLALNAAVEAARAGQAGAGFAVVADEVRNLAIRAAEAAKNTSALIQKTIVSVRNGNELTRSTQDAFRENRESTQKIQELVQEIAAASNDQAQGIENVNQVLTEVDKITQQNAAYAEETASASSEMNSQADRMKEIVEELVELVGGKSHRDGRKQASEEPEEEELEFKPLPKVTERRKQITPEQVIPLDDDDFKDF